MFSMLLPPWPPSLPSSGLSYLNFLSVWCSTSLVVVLAQICIIKSSTVDIINTSLSPSDLRGQNWFPGPQKPLCHCLTTCFIHSHFSFLPNLGARRLRANGEVAMASRVLVLSLPSTGMVQLGWTVWEVGFWMFLVGSGNLCMTVVHWEFWCWTELCILVWGLIASQSLPDSDSSERDTKG